MHDRTTTAPTTAFTPSTRKGIMSQDILSGLAVIVNEVAGVPVEDVTSDKSFVDDLDIDSLSMVEVVMAAEDKWGVKIPDSEVKNLKTVGDAVTFIAAHS